MKNKKQWTKKILTGIIALSLLSLTSMQTVHSRGSLPKGIEPDDCTVTESRDGDSGRESITLRTALMYASQSLRRNQACRQKIVVDTDVVNLNTPLEIDVPNISDGNMNGNSHYLIVGKNSSDPKGRVTLDFSNMKKPGSKDCAIIFKGDSHHIRFKNFNIANIKNVPAVCIRNGVNNIELNNVRITQVKGGGHGILIGSEATSTKITSDSELDNISGDGIHINNTAIEGYNSITGTDRKMAGDGNKTDANGTVVFEDADAPANDFVMKELRGNYISSAVDAKVLFSEISPIANEDGKYLIRGAVAKNAVSCLNFVPESDSDIGSKIVQKVKRIHVYATSVEAANQSGGTNAVFLTYVTKQADCFSGTCAYGIGASLNPIGSAGNYGGLFSFILDTKELLERINTRATSELGLTEIGNIILVPELSNGTIASASEVKDINDIQDVNLCSGESAGSSGGSDDGYIGNLAFKTQQECGLRRNSSTLAPALYDSDGDGIYDNDEDINGNCECDPQEFSCWNNPDSDFDGIIDSVERLGGTINRDISVAGFCGAGEIPNSGTRVTDICDVDSDGISNAQEDLSDSDLLKDYEEDRARTFISGRKAHYYIWGATSGVTPYKDNEDRHVECTQLLVDSGQSSKGVKYGIFRVKADRSGTPEEHDYTRPLDNMKLAKLVCRNDSVAGGTNFNGRVDASTGETHAYLGDTNNDGTDDYTCPGTMVNGECRLDCIDYEIFQALDPEYVNESRTALKKEGGVPVIYKKSWQEITNLSTNIDRDGIPDVVENESGACLSQRVNGGQNLNPYLKSSDGDDIADNVDRCPFTFGEDCTDADARRIYVHRPILAFFLDRDRDGLSDGQEECPSEVVASTTPQSDSSGSASNSIFRFFVSGARAQTIGSSSCTPDGDPNYATGMEGRYITATDPLLPDTDSDGVGDYIEVVTWRRHTNPADSNTDNDGLPDGLEVKDYTRPVPTEYPPQNGQLCGLFKRLDPGSGEILDGANVEDRLGTDPANADTDGDGVQDGVEVRGSYNGDIANLLSGAFPAAGFDLVSNPLADDSDGDGIKDGDEYGTDGIVQYGDSNPCALDTDADGESDISEKETGCSTSALPNAVCKRTETGAGGTDSDGDGLSDTCERSFAPAATDPQKIDSDEDGLKDNEEDVNGNCQVDAGETDPMVVDSDGDELNDGDEVKLLHTNPLKLDTDSDCIADGVEVNKNPQSSFTGTDTDPTSPDTDGDGLCDGNNNQTNGGVAGNVTCIRGEDLDCDGKVKTNPNDPNLMLETDPRNADSDNDGENDQSEVCHGGSCNIAANVGRATQGASSGCFSVSGATPTDPSSMLYVFGLLVMINRLMAMKARRKILPFVRGGRVG